jgi:cytochrome oxidase Cu insertion factor (SCO1/SenC/PrrC family)
MRAPLRLVLPIASALLALILVLAIVLDTSKDPSGGSTTASDARTSGSFDGAVLPSSARAPDFTLSDQHGHATSLSSYRGKVVVLVFLSSRCRACVLVAQQVRGALDELTASTSASKDTSAGAVNDVQVIFVSTDPSADTPASVGRFLSETSLSGRVEFLVASPSRLRALWHAYGFAPTSSGQEASYPATAVLLIDRSGSERVELGLEQLTPESLAHDIRKLLGG